MNPDIAAAANAAFAPNNALIRELGNLITQGATAAGSNLQASKGASVNEIIQRAKQGGMQFGGYSPDEEARLFGVDYAPALANVLALPQLSNLKLGQALASLDVSKGTGTFGSSQVASELSQQEDIGARKNAAQLEAARIREAREQANRAARAAKLDPEDEAELSIQSALEYALNNPDAAGPGYREKVRDIVSRSFRDKGVSAGKIANFVNNYFPDEWERLYGLR